MIHKTILFLVSISLILPATDFQTQVGHTEITKWQYGKKAAVSLTYDDSTINQFRVALPLMNERGFPGTFYIVTGAIPGSEYEPKFVGRPVEEIIAETAQIPTNKENFYERASAIRFLGYEGTYRYHNEAAGFYGNGELQKAYDIIDEGFRKVRNGEFEPSNGYHDELYNVLAIEDPSVDLITWDKLQKYAQQDHEFGSHTILHPWLAVMDSANIRYELEKSRLDILNHLGPGHTFSAECPFGTEDERVMKYAHKIFPALRNRMPHPWLAELNRASDIDPRTPEKEYVQWQRGPLSDTPVKKMKSWIDTSLEKDNIWLVLVFHGIEGVGWEPLSKDKLKEYFDYIKKHEEQLWVATFKDVTKYHRERMNADIKSKRSGQTVTINLTHSLDRALYRLPLTLKTYVPEKWKAAQVKQEGQTQGIEIQEDEKGAFIQYQAQPNSGSIIITEQ
ncbi:polysaccharide deacetylase family protein [Aliifodinibius sp. S!AR15-10]|uniref:polysaccharide deacetylase family protein n=1 Tax=Aliifodinibius sp. S!AR15-10 TaxID=2950437 RepID=UPI002856CC2A|nr:polysaccharide deacetylase family protein [Aliifodinibius sp. S!AR15-10]MDR8393123.1 polysaccharide deacetylase family protein [Aliifodinibius sp. S!AR15-10]